LTANADDKLEFDEQIGRVGEDARFVLSADIRNVIMRVAPQVLQPDQGALD